MLACAKRFNYVDKQFRGGNFLVRMNMENTYELGGKTLGMIGCGVNYPIYRKIIENGKQKYAYEIVELAREISEGK